LGGVRSRLRLWAEPADEEEGEPEGWTASVGNTTEKLEAEALWLAEKMAACGAVGEAVVRWGAAAGLGQMTLASEPQLQGTFVRISARTNKSMSAGYREATMVASGFETAHSAARAYDREATKFRGVDADINFCLEDYIEDMKHVR
ncbi:hypothetical protein Taro_016627, partial [Colocasia esculenta]|nr:hypothetical protein [Colocasia esculenta]